MSKSPIKKSPVKSDTQENIPEIPKKVEEPMVEGIFTNLEMEGQPVKFTWAVDKGRPTYYKIEDGERLKLPYSVAKHLNSCKYVDKAPKVDRHGRSLGVQERVVNRFSFRRIDDFMDDDI